MFGSYEIIAYVCMCLFPLVFFGIFFHFGLIIIIIIV